MTATVRRLGRIDCARCGLHFVSHHPLKRTRAYLAHLGDCIPSTAQTTASAPPPRPVPSSGRSGHLALLGAAGPSRPATPTGPHP